MFMKSHSITLITAITAILVLSTAANHFSLANEHWGHQAGDQTKEPTPSTDGSVNPDAIPDTAAYEILFRLLSYTNKEEPKVELRKSAYLRVAGFDPAEVAAISNAAYEFKRLTEPLDARVNDLKNQHWPSPSHEVLDQLAELQKQKQALIQGLVDKLQSQLAHYAPSKLSNHVARKIKPRIKGFVTPLPPKEVSTSGRQSVSPSTAPAAQGIQCKAELYIFNEITIDWEQFIVFTTSAYSQPYDNCGHIITLSTQLWGPADIHATGVEGAHIDLQRPNGVYIDGKFHSKTSAEAYCPVANSKVQVGSN
jgi:hypothetical protein